MSDLSYDLRGQGTGLRRDRLRWRVGQTPEPGPASQSSFSLPSSAPAVPNTDRLRPDLERWAAPRPAPGADEHDLLAIEPIDPLTVLLFGGMILACLAGWAGVGLVLGSALGGLAS